MSEPGPEPDRLDRKELSLDELLDGPAEGVDEEIRFYLEMRIRELVEEEGLDPEEARRKALDAFGDVERIRKAARREARGSPLERWRTTMGGWVLDVRFALRTAVRSPLLTGAVILTLGLGIGAATGVFTVVDATLLRALPFEDADRLVFLQGYAETPEGPRIRGASPAEIRDWEEMSRSFRDVAISDGTVFNVTGEDGARRISGEFVSAGYFELLGASPLLGRTFRADEDGAPGSGPVALIGEGLWERRYGRSDDVLGRTLELNDRALTIVGVMPEPFPGVTLTSEIWVPSSMLYEIGNGSTPDARGGRWIVPVARLAPGVSVEEAERDLQAVARRLEEAHPETNTDRSAFVTPVRDVYLGSTAQLVWILFGAVGLLVVLACANVANLLLLRAGDRGSEVLMRVALGAGRGRILRQFLIEGVVLAALGAGLGLLIAVAGVSLAEGIMPPNLLPAYADLTLNGQVFAFAAGLTGLVGVLAGIAPAVTASRVDVAQGLKTGARAVTGGGSPRLRTALVAGEVALALVLVVGAVLMMRSFRAQLDVRPGYDVQRLLAFRLQVPETSYADEELTPFVQELQEQLLAVPGVESVAVGSSLPLRDRSSGAFLYLPERQEIERVRFYMHRVTPGYFSTLGIPILRGRPVEPGDDVQADVVVASRGFVERFFADQNPVGQTIHLGGDDGPAFTIVGVAEDVRYRDLTSDLAAGDDDPDLYLPYMRAPDRSFDVAVRTRLDPGSLITPVRDAVSRVDPALAVFDLAPLADELRLETAQGRFGSVLLGAFSSLALILAVIGIYGVMASMVGRRSREIAIRMAMGADAGTLRNMVVGRGVATAGAGLALGIGAALVLSRFLESFLFRVGGTDPVTYGAVALGILAVTWVAAWLPARRATRLDPQSVLREE